MDAAGVSEMTEAVPTDLDEVALHATIRMK